MLSMEDFPDEVIINIMTYLALPDRKNCRLVQRRWCDLSYSARLTKEDVIVVNQPSDLLKLNLTRKYFNIKIKNLSSSKAIDFSFWNKCGSHVHSIEMYLFSFSNIGSLKLILSLATKLEYLLVSQYDENDKSRAPVIFNADYGIMALPNLLSLDFLHLNQRNSMHLRYFLESAPKLKRLSLEWLVGDWLEELEEPLRNFAKKHSTILKEINFSYSSINSDFLKNILSFISSQLTGLYLRRCRILDDNCISIIKTNFPNLKEIDLSYNLFSENTLCSLFESLSKLTHISLIKTHASSSLLSVIMAKNKLKALELSECKFSNDWTQSFTAGSSEHLIDLRLDKVAIVNSDIEVIVKSAVNLKFLSLNCCGKLNDTALKCISHYCTKLRSLSLQNWVSLKDVSVVNNLKGLIHLDLYGCGRVTDLALSKLSLLELQTTDLSCTNLTINSLSIFLDHCPSIQDIYLGIEIENEITLLKETRQIDCKLHFGLGKFSAESIFDN